MSELGRRLKLEREKKGISVQEIGLSLKINPRVIAAMEEGERDILPAKTFLRGFVKSYAQFLRMDVKETLDQFNLEYVSEPLLPPNINTDPNAIPSDNPTPSAILSIPKAAASTPEKSRGLSDPGGLSKDNISHDSRFPIGKIVLGVALFVVVIVLAKLVNKYQKERVLPAKEKVTAVGNSESDIVVETTDDVTDGPATTTAGTVSTALGEEAGSGVLSTGTHGAALNNSTMSTSANPAVSSISSVPSAKPVASTPEPTPSPTPKATPTPKPSPTPKATPEATPKPSPSPKATPTPKPSPTPAPPAESATPAVAPAGKPVEVMVEVTKPVRIRYDLGDGKTTTLDLNAGELHTFKSKMPISLDISDGSALNLIVNGRDRGKAGGAGEPVKLRLAE